MNIIHISASLLLPLSGCLLHVGDPDNRHTSEEELEVSVPSGDRIVRRFEVTADAGITPQLLDFGLAGEVVVHESGVETALTLRDVATGNEIVVEQYVGYPTDDNTLPLTCSSSGPCTHLVDVELARRDALPTPWTGTLRLMATGRLGCCGTPAGELTVAAAD